MVYILELARPLGNHRHQARFYVGWTKNEATLQQRLDHHRKGTGAAFTRAAVERGIDFQLVLTLPEATKTDERRIKNQKNTRRFVERHLRRQSQP
jgi:putative endonuclease